MLDPTLSIVAQQLLGQPALAGVRTLESIAFLVQAERERHAEAEKEGRLPAPARQQRAQQHRLSPSGRPGPKVYRQDGKGSAIVRAVGTLVTRGEWFEERDGLVSYEGLQAQLSAAAEDPAVLRIILDIDSPGGALAGAFTTADAVRRAAAKKPVIALVADRALGAAYLLASAATKIVATQTATLGEIGVAIHHEDHSRRLEAEGVAPTIIQAGARKTGGTPLRPLSDQDTADLQAQVDGIYDLLVSAVAQGRDLTEEAVRTLGARTLSGQEAIAAGLVDELGTMETARTTAPERRNLPPPVPAPATASAEDHARAAERARIAAILGCPEAQGRQELARYLAFQTDRAPADAQAIMAAAPANHRA